MRGMVDEELVEAVQIGRTRQNNNNVTGHFILCGDRVSNFAWHLFPPKRDNDEKKVRSYSSSVKRRMDLRWLRILAEHQKSHHFHDGSATS
jgi:hypothetical protein